MCEKKHTSPLPNKIMENTLRYTKSEENLQDYFRHDTNNTAHTPPGGFSVYHQNDSDHDCWSQEDDDILQVRDSGSLLNPFIAASTYMHTELVSFCY